MMKDDILIYTFDDHVKGNEVIAHASIRGRQAALLTQEAFLTSVDTGYCCR